jgi:hypothetical protein
MACSIWEFLTFPPEILEDRLRTMNFQAREHGRLEALRQHELTVTAPPMPEGRFAAIEARLLDLEDRLASRN